MAAKVRDGLGSVRSVLKRWTTPLLPDDYTQLINPLWSIRELRGQIVSVTKHSDDTVSLIIRPGWGVPVEFEAGQYIGIGVQIDGRYTWRSYSLTNAPRPEKGLLSITVRAVEKGKLSNHLVGTAREGMEVRLAAPAGDFHLTDPVPEKLLFITAGTGITPVMSMLRTLEERGQLGDVVLVHSTRERENFLFESEVAKMSEKNPSFVRHLRVTSEEGRLTTADIEKLVPDFAQRAPYACGPSEMLDDLEKWWESAGSDEELRTERFTLDRASDAQGGEITFGNRATVEVDGATTILEAAESEGIQLPFGCRMGICQTCVQQVEEGHALNLRTGEIHEPGTRIRVCVCVASGNLKLDV